MVFGVCETFVFWRNIFLLIGVSVTFAHPQAARLGSARLTRTARPAQFLCTRPWRAEILSSRPGPRNFCPHGPCTLLSTCPLDQANPPNFCPRARPAEAYQPALILITEGINIFYWVGGGGVLFTPSFLHGLRREFIIYWGYIIHTPFSFLHGFRRELIIYWGYILLTPLFYMNSGRFA